MAVKKKSSDSSTETTITSPKAKEKGAGRQRKEYCAELITLQKYDDEKIAEMVNDKFTDREFPVRRVGVVRREMNEGKRGKFEKTMKKFVMVDGKLQEYVHGSGSKKKVAKKEEAVTDKKPAAKKAAAKKPAAKKPAVKKVPAKKGAKKAARKK